MTEPRQSIDMRLFAIGTAVALVPFLSLDLAGIGGSGKNNLTVCFQQLNSANSHAAAVALIFHGFALCVVSSAFGLFIQYVAVNSGLRLKERVDEQVHLDFRDPGEVGEEPAGLWKGEPDPPAVPAVPPSLDRLIVIRGQLAKRWEREGAANGGSPNQSDG